MGRRRMAQNRTLRLAVAAQIYEGVNADLVGSQSLGGNRSLNQSLDTPSVKRNDEEQVNLSCKVMDVANG
jgi:hypothetical protein